MLYSATTNGFYKEGINLNIPDDAIEIDEDFYHELLAGQREGKIIKSDSNGNPVLSDPPEPTEEEKKETVLQQRDELMQVARCKIELLNIRIKHSDYDESQDDTPEKRSLTAWEKYYIALDDITQQPNFPNDIVWPEMPE